MGFFENTDTPKGMVWRNFAREYMLSLGFSQENGTILTEMIIKLPGKKET